MTRRKTEFSSPYGWQDDLTQKNSVSTLELAWFKLFSIEKSNSHIFAQAENLPISRKVDLATCEVIEGDIGGLNDMLGDKRCAFCRALLWNF